MPENKFVALLEAIVPGGRSVKVGAKIYDLTEKPREYLKSNPKRFIAGKTVVAVTLDDNGKILFMSPTDEKPTVEPDKKEYGRPASSTPPTSGSDFNVSLWQTCLNCATQIVASSLTEVPAKDKAQNVIDHADFLYRKSVERRDGVIPPSPAKA